MSPSKLAPAPDSTPVTVRTADHLSGSPELQATLQRPPMKRAQTLMQKSIILRTKGGQLVVAEIDEVEAYDKVGPNFQKSFGAKKRQPGQWFSQRLQAGRVFCEVVDPAQMSVVRIKTVRVNGRKMPLSVLMKEHFGDRDFDGQPLPESSQLLQNGADVFLTPKATSEVQLEVRTGTDKVLGTVTVVRG